MPKKIHRPTQAYTHTPSPTMDGFPEKPDSSTSSHSSKSCLILSLAACYLSAGSEEGQRVEGQRQEAGWQRHRERLSSSDKETSWIGVYHAFNWTLSLCLAGCWTWTTGMCQLASRPSPSPVHSCYQPPTIWISLCFSLLLSLTPSRPGSASTSFLHLPPS